MEIDEAKLRTLVRKRAPGRLKKLRKVAEMLYQGLGVTEIVTACQVNHRSVAEVRETLGIVAVCECGKPANHREPCRRRQERDAIVNTDGLACGSGFASSRCKRFLERNPELKAAVIHFRRQGCEGFPDVSEILAKLSRYGAITDRQAATVLRAHEAARRRKAECKSGATSSHCGIMGQRVLRMKLQIVGITRLERRHFKIDAVDEAGNVFTWSTKSADDLPEGWFPMDCTVAEHAYHDGRAETVLRQCLLRPLEEEEGPFKEIIGELERIEKDLDAGSDLWERLHLARAALGDTRSFDALATRMRHQMVHTAVVNVGTSDADDVVQMALLRAWTYACRFRFGCPVWAWMISLTRQVAISELVSRLRRRELSLEMKIEAHAEGDKWEPVSSEMPPWGGLLLRELEAEKAGA